MGAEGLGGIDFSKLGTSGGGMPDLSALGGMPGGGVGEEGEGEEDVCSDLPLKSATRAAYDG